MAAVISLFPCLPRVFPTWSGPPACGLWMQRRRPAEPAGCHKQRCNRWIPQSLRRTPGWSLCSGWRCFRRGVAGWWWATPCKPQPGYKNVRCSMRSEWRCFSQALLAVFVVSTCIKVATAAIALWWPQVRLSTSESAAALTSAWWKVAMTSGLPPSAAAWAASAAANLAALAAALALIRSAFRARALSISTTVLPESQSSQRIDGMCTAHSPIHAATNSPIMEERQRAKPRARATWLVMQLQGWGLPRKTMEQRKVTTSEKSREKLNRASLAFTRGVPMWATNTTWRRSKGNHNVWGFGPLTHCNKGAVGFTGCFLVLPECDSPRHRWWPEPRRRRWRWEWSPAALRRRGTQWSLIRRRRELHWTTRHNCTGCTHEHLSEREGPRLSPDRPRKCRARRPSRASTL